VDNGGYLISLLGQRLQGYNDPACSTLGDLSLDNNGAESEPSVKNVQFAPDGKVWIELSDGTRFVRGQILLQNFRSPELLIRKSYKLYVPAPAAGPLERPAPPASAGLGELRSGWFDFTLEPVRLSLLSNARLTGALTQGVLTRTGFQTDLGLEGAGFFLVRDPKSGAIFATRVGMFLVDAEGYLITYDRFRVQGYCDSELSAPGDIRIDGMGSLVCSPDVVVTSYSFESSGDVIVRFSDGTGFIRGKIRLWNFAHPEFLTPTNHGLYSGVTRAQPVPSDSARVQAGCLELVNVPEESLAQRRSFTYFVYGFYQDDETETHLAILGAGFFALRDPKNDTLYLTRVGKFQFDAQGYLVGPGGLRVQGFKDSDLTVIGDLRIDAEDLAAAAAPICFERDGKITVLLADGDRRVLGQILLQICREPFVLQNNGSDLYTNLAASFPLPRPAQPYAAGLGSIISRFLEIPDAPEELRPTPRDGIRIMITGEPGWHWTLQAANCPREWTTLKEIDDSPEEMEFTDTDSNLCPQRNYRVIARAPGTDQTVLPLHPALMPAFRPRVAGNAPPYQKQTLPLESMRIPSTNAPH